MPRWNSVTTRSTGASPLWWVVARGRGGVVATASYEARLFGIRSALPSRIAAQRCARLSFVKPRFEVYPVLYQADSDLGRYTDLIEPLSLDEAYLDVTANKPGIGSAWRSL